MAIDNSTTKKILFVCSQNRLRSPTAEKIFSEESDLDVKSAGIYQDATNPISSELVEWADIIFVMEKRQRNAIHKKFKDIYRNKRIICLYIPDEYEYMNPELIQLLKKKVSPYLHRIHY